MNKREMAAIKKLAQNEAKEKELSDNTIFAAEASDLGWKVGEYPSSLFVYGADFFHYRTDINSEGEVTKWIYKSHKLKGKYAQIFND